MEEEQTQVQEDCFGRSPDEIEAARKAEANTHALREKIKELARNGVKISTFDALRVRKNLRKDRAKCEILRTKMEQRLPGSIDSESYQPQQIHYQLRKGS